MLQFDKKLCGLLIYNNAKTLKHNVKKKKNLYIPLNLELDLNINVV